MVEETASTTKPAIVVTGASSGIGMAIARVAARDGSFLLLIGRSGPALGNLVADLARDGVAGSCTCP